MRSCFYRRIPCPTDLAVALPPRTRAYACLDIDAPYPAATLSALLSPGDHSASLPMGNDTRCLALAELPDIDTAMLLAAQGVDATVTATTMLLFEGIDDAAYRALRNALCPAAKDEPIRRALPDDAFVGFTRSPHDVICAEAARYGLALPEPCLGVIADHFRALGRDPWPDELCLLDEAYRAAVADPAVSAPVELITDDEGVQAAYTDAMAKRRLLDPAADAPATLAELAALATRYLCAHRGCEMPPRRINAPIAARRLGGFTNATASVTLAELPVFAGTAALDDRVVLLSPGEEDFAAATAQVFADAKVCALMHRALPVKAGRLLPALGRLLGEAGLGLALTALPEGVALTDRLTAVQDGLLIACPAASGRTLPDALRAAGLRFTLLGQTTRKPLLTLAGAPERLCLPVAMLAPRPALYAEYRAGAAPTAADVPLRAALMAGLAQAGEAYGCDPLTASEVAAPPVTLVRAGHELLTALDCAPGSDPYAAVRDAALVLIARFVAAGIKPDAVTLALTATLPTATPYDCGRAIAALMGLHTAQVELGCLAEPAELRSGEVLSITLAAHAPAPSVTLPRLAADMPLWLVAPRSHAPHLDGERALFALAATEQKVSHPLCATEAFAPAVAATRVALETGLTVVLTAPDEVLTAPIPGGMIVAAPEMPRLPEGVAAIALGYTLAGLEQVVYLHETPVARDAALAALRGDLPAPIQPAPTVAHPPRVSSYRVARPRVLIPYRADAPSPSALAQTVAACGGEPMLCPLDMRTAASARVALSVFADALDGAQLLLIGDGGLLDALLAGRRSAESLTRMRGRDGLVCVWGDAFVRLLARGEFTPDGKPITVKPMRQPMLASVLCSTASPWVDDLPLGYGETVMFAGAVRCPQTDAPSRAALAERGLIVACAAGTPDGTVAVTAMASPDGGLLGRVAPPTAAVLRSGIAYFA